MSNEQTINELDQQLMTHPSMDAQMDWDEVVNKIFDANRTNFWCDVPESDVEYAILFAHRIIDEYQLAVA